MKAVRLLLSGLAVLCLGASRPDEAAVKPYLGEHFEKVQSIVRGYVQEYHEGIRVTGTPRYIAHVREALDLLEARDSRNWYYVRKHVRRITLSGHPGMDIGGGRLTTADEAGVSAAATAGAIVHEAWHRELFFSGRPWEGREAERVCLEKQNEALEKMGEAPLDLEGLLGSEYWNVDYWSRDW